MDQCVEKIAMDQFVEKKAMDQFVEKIAMDQYNFEGFGKWIGKNSNFMKFYAKDLIFMLFYDFI